MQVLITRLLVLSSVKRPLAGRLTHLKELG